jgi:hypothetical protein
MYSNQKPLYNNLSYQFNQQAITPNYINNYPIQMTYNPY